MLFTLLFTTLFIAMLLPFLAKAPLVIAMNRQPGGYDNRYPRVQQQQLEGFGQRATAAHYNSFEALLIYGLAVFTAVAFNAVDTFTVVLGWVFIGSRVVYLLCYWYDKSTLRSLSWLVGTVACFTIAGRAIWGS
ncbi:MAPEG family protein [Aliidiomarina halalkaliphila]|uniref:MAPEG family protein n=2 Tax=Aliidiomarina halalkaliphila TaxID=2593535 RepID=A0A552X683_9GAMM|nr:MAPEG family protein [Aliidiomarina halalkaliphila]